MLPLRSPLTQLAALMTSHRDWGSRGTREVRDSVVRRISERCSL